MKSALLPQKGCLLHIAFCSGSGKNEEGKAEGERQKEKGRSWDYHYAPVYQISFLNFPNTIVETEKEAGNPYISHYVYKSKDTGKELGDDTNIIFIDLAKFRKDYEECENQCEKWLYSIRNMHLMKERPEGIEGTELDALYSEAYFAAWTPEMRILYEKYIMNRNDYENILQERFDDGMVLGMEKGIEKGIDKGRKEGVEKVARRLKSMGMDFEAIAEATRLTAEAINNL